jgi:glyoxylase-like metal-dependent hydrolase (beta-lactamase superfamily II)
MSLANPTGPKFKQDYTAHYGEAECMSPRVQRVLCENPSPYTYTGTGTYLVGSGTDVAVIDPGPSMPEHGEALMRAIGTQKVSHILVTHTHMDHSPLSSWLKERTGAPIYGFGPHGTGRKGGLAEEDIEAGADKTFRPDIQLKDGMQLSGDDWTLETLHTPGHTANHVCFHLLEEKTVFVGDHIMAWATTVISPPDGDMNDYLASLKKVAALDANHLVPTHGPWVEKPEPFIRGIITHRRMREGQILKLMETGLTTIDALVSRMYKDVDKRLHPLAARSVLAHMIALTEAGRIACDGPPTLDQSYHIA